jgi:coatomer subunit beta'
VLDGRTKVKAFKNFKERMTPVMKGSGGWAVEGLHGGPLLAARGASFVVFWDWESGEIVRRIDAEAKSVSFRSAEFLDDSFFFRLTRPL